MKVIKMVSHRMQKETYDENRVRIYVCVVNDKVTEEPMIG